MKRLWQVSVICGAFISLMLSMNSYAENSEYSDLIATVQKYLDGTSKGTPHLLSEAFDPDAKLQFIRGEKLVSWAVKDYIAGFEDGVEYDRIGRIVNVDITKTAASVKVEIEMNGNIYVDYLLLLDTKNGWKIVNKIFSTR